MIHAKLDPGGRLKAEWVLSDLGSAGHFPHGCNWGFDHSEQKSKERSGSPKARDPARFLLLESVPGKGTGGVLD